MPKAFITNKSGEKIVIANSDETIHIEGNHYFPPDSVNNKYLVDSDTHTTCFWKGESSYKTIKAGEQEQLDAVWYYPKPMKGAIDRVGKDFSSYYAFWQGVEVEE